MGRTIVYSLACYAVLFFAVPLPAAFQDSFADSYAESIQTLLDDKFADSDSGMVVAIVDEHGSRVFSAGALDNGTDRTVDADTIFELGSVTKVFTSLLLVDAVTRGEMQLDDPVAKYLPDHVKMPSFEGQEVTLEHLAAQESGLPFHPDRMQRTLSARPTIDELKALKAASDAYTVDDLHQFLSKHQLTSKPGAGFQYSNAGMALLGHAMERRTGKDYESLVIERICRPLGMDSTRIKLPPEMKARLARGHWSDGTQSEHVNFQAMASAGALTSTANDLVKFLSASLGFAPSRLTPLMKQTHVIRHTDSPRFGTTAMPWFDQGVYNPPGTQILAHGGGGLGNLAFLGLDTKRRRGVAILTNQLGFSPYGIGWTLLQDLPLTHENITFWVKEIVGLGVALEKVEDSGALRISRVFPKSPAGEAGLNAGLVISQINGTPTAGKSLQECLQMLGGPEGTPIQLQLVDPANSDAKQVVELNRKRFLTATY